MTDIQTIRSTLANLRSDGETRLGGVADLETLAEVERSILGKRSALAGLGAALKDLAGSERAEAGQALQQTRQALSDFARQVRDELDRRDAERRLVEERLDLSEIACGSRRPPLAASSRSAGHLHLVTQTRDELEETFISMGFDVVEGPEVETDWYNFEALNMPPDHPARGMWDTLYLRLGSPETVLLRTHTSPVQVRLMSKGDLPIYSVMPGRCYRRDTPDARHLPVFHQIEGLVVDEGITFGDMAGVIEVFTEAFFGEGMHSRLRPSFFPFTEPSAEFEVTCPICAGAGCRTCSGSGWIELGGCGMVDPNVFTATGIDPERYSGFAFGFGIDRLAQVRTSLADMRALLDNDVRFLSQF
ncbi:MAG: phenylalanine--tRNA ligase subunit alpha [Acidimicrobiales bacterium]